MERTSMGRGASARVVAAGSAALLAASLAATSVAVAQDGDLPPAEQSDLTVAIPFPDIVMYSRYYIADGEGYLDEEGLTIEVVTADDPVAAVLSGSADIGVQSAGAAVLAVDEGLDVEIIGSHSCRQSFSFAVQPGIESVEDLAGTDIVMAGTPGDPAQFERERVLREAGWDISTIDANVVYPGPDSATWRQFFLAGNVSMMPFYSDDLAALQEYGAVFPISELKNWPNDVYVTRSGWVDENPGTAARFLRAVMKATDFLQAPALGEVAANKDRILEIYRANEYEAVDEEANEGVYALNSHNYCDNLYYDADAMATTVGGQELDVDVTFDEVANLSALEAAQASLGKSNEPPAELPWP